MRNSPIAPILWPSILILLLAGLLLPACVYYAGSQPPPADGLSNAQNTDNTSNTSETSSTEQNQAADTTDTADTATRTKKQNRSPLIIPPVPRPQPNKDRNPVKRREQGKPEPTPVVPDRSKEQQSAVLSVSIESPKDVPTTALIKELERLDGVSIVENSASATDRHIKIEKAKVGYKAAISQNGSRNVNAYDAKTLPLLSQKISDKIEQDLIIKQFTTLSNSRASFEVHLWSGDKGRRPGKGGDGKPGKDRIGNKDALSFEVSGLPEREKVTVLIFHVDSHGNVEFLSPEAARASKGLQVRTDEEIHPQQVYQIPLAAKGRRSEKESNQRAERLKKNSDYYQIIATSPDKNHRSALPIPGNLKPGKLLPGRTTRQNDEAWQSAKALLAAMSHNKVRWATDSLTLDGE
jgi:hypothetical protein